MNFEIKKIAILIRILMALELIRVVQVVFAYFLSNGKTMAHDQWIFGFLAVAAPALVFFNYKRQWTAIIAAVVIYKFDFVFNCNSISTAVFTFLCFFISAYEYFVIAVKSEQKSGNLEVIIALLWLAYGYINLTSAWNHLEDPYWRNGNAMELFFSNPYYSAFYSFFRNVQHQFPSFSRVFFQMLTWGIMAFQFIIVPLYFFKAGRIILRIWSVLLLITIGVFLKISLLPHFTLILVLLVLFRKPTAPIYLGMLRPKNMHATQLKTTVLVFYSICILGLLLHTPKVNKAADQVFWSMREWDTKLWLNRKLAMFGIHKPDVFNTNHVEGGQRWYVIYRMENKQRKLVPFFDTQGARLSYSGFDPLLLRNHGSDYLYFGNTVQYVLGNDTVTYQNSATPYRFKGNSLTRLISFDYFRRGFEGEVFYEVDFYERPFKTQNGHASWNTDAIKMGSSTFLMKASQTQDEFPKKLTRVGTKMPRN